MSLPARLIGLVARRFLPPTALASFAAALALAMLVPWSPSAVRGAGELSPEVNAGLARSGVWLTALTFALPWFCARACWCVRHWRRGDGDWLGTGVLSRAEVALCHACGAWLALALVLAPFAVAAEARAGALVPRLRWIADTKVGSILITSSSQRPSVSLTPPSGANVALARFAVVAPGDGGARTQLRCKLERAATTNLGREVVLTDSAALEVQLPAGSGAATLSFERVGAGGVALLEDSRISWFESAPPRWRIAAALFLQTWLAGAVACAIALCVATWSSAGTAFLAAFAVLACAWLGDQLPLAWPGVGLSRALQLCSDGLGAGDPAPLTWLCAALIVAAALALPALQRDLWRRDA